MIKVDDALVKRLEELARLKLTDEQRKSIQKDMNEILQYMELLNEVDVSNVEPMYTPVEESATLREDEVKPFENLHLLRSNFPKERSGHIVVPGIHA
ncbi:Asp-tRNA(Asn)/Glu-tRNA(Gln) amidotransferase subunit GatC [Pseudothermotoga thermarum]|uniref:Aspartyl/glutamyl-tRNA(Asn/Gln) amidotransferase subunit C n=1 Tax=Pseudothermotoga thermarum DSM 5069 TaxID=688269 RepID=F7YYV5_9THEM|nr:Asp-tRNA(Asn)/Glu-tRNA(Gln) amidotransferase subunit GatC [Pseudothermotoga thermarum]AEH51148.1 aspartyl/glutamyl-tRNA(Asn/Gln) amidotransferase subunit C [Pseudothermotoga thermarum DSM 5069]